MLRKARYQRLVELKLIDPAWPLPPRDAQELPWEDINPSYRDWFDERMAVYAAMIEQMDRGVGAIVDAVKARGDRDNTLIVFLSDNGGCAEEIFTTGRTRPGLSATNANGPAGAPRQRSDDHARSGRHVRLLRTGMGGAVQHAVSALQEFRPRGRHCDAAALCGGRRGSAGNHARAGPCHRPDADVSRAGRDTYPAEYTRQSHPAGGRAGVWFRCWTGRHAARAQSMVWEHEGNRALRQGDWKLVSRLPGERGNSTT